MVQIEPKPKRKRKRKLIIRREEIMAFYQAVGAGVFDGELETKQRIEQKYFAAQLEGRIK